MHLIVDIEQIVNVIDNLPKVRHLKEFYEEVVKDVFAKICHVN